MDHKTQARLIVVVEEKKLAARFSELLYEYGQSVDNIPDRVFQEISENSNCNKEESGKLFDAYVHWNKSKH